MQRQVYIARPEVLQERIPKTFKLFPVADYWYLKRGNHTEFCPEHEPNCIRFRMAWYFVPVCNGWWSLKTPIDIKAEMPGSEHVLTYAELESMIRIGWGTWILENTRVFRVRGDETVVWEVWNEKITQGDGKFETNKYPMKIDVSTYKTLDVDLVAVLRCLTGGFETHFRNMLITVEYVPTTPPEPATVRIYVYDRATVKPIGGALVQLLSGNKIVAQGYTGGDGWVTLLNVPAGVEGVSYTLLVTKGGYEDYKDEATVVPGENVFRVALTSIPAPPIPWNWIALGVGVVAVGGVAMALMRKPAAPVVVVREGR